MNRTAHQSLLGGLLVAAVPSVVVGGCTAQFDRSDKTACLSDEDCVGGRVCALTGARFGECVATEIPDRSDAAEVPDESPPACADGDDDGFSASTGCGALVDCDDGAAAINPGATEICNGVDDDCDRAVDEAGGSLTDPDDCGQCGRVCNDDHASVRCSAGECVVDSCEPGWWDRDELDETGCEAQCDAAERVCTDGRDDDCDGAPDSSDSDCQVESPLSDRSFRLLVWTDAAIPELVVGDVAFDATGAAARLTHQQGSDPESPGRGRSRSDASWSVRSDDAGTLVVASGATEITLRRSVAAPIDFLAGFSSEGDLYTLVARGSRPPDLEGSWLTWVVSPLNELEVVPGGRDELGWEEPVELAFLRLSGASLGGRGGASWPFVEYRDAWVGSPEADGTLRPMSYAVWPDGVFALELLSADAGGLEREFSGAVVPSGDLFVTAHRFVGDFCEDRAVTLGTCIHDPVVGFGIRRGHPVSARGMSGRWRLVGLSYAGGTTEIDGRALDVEFEVAADGLVRGGLSGSVGVFGSSDTYVSPTVRLDLRGDAVGGGTLVLEGLMSSLEYGLFWDQSGVTDERPMNGGVYFLFAR